MTRSLAASTLVVLALSACSLAACTSEVTPEDGPTASTSDELTLVKINPGTIVLRTTGTLMCRSREGAGTHAEPLADVPIEIGGQRVTTASNGTFSFAGGVSASSTLRVIYEGPIAGSGISTPLQIMDELKNTRSESKTVAVGGATFALGTIELTSLDCELWRIGGKILRDYHAVRGAQPPAHKLRVMRWSEVSPAVHTFYDYINVGPDYPNAKKTAAEREETMFHEFGHGIRHVADGDEAHWNWDNFRWAYARSHNGDEIFNVQYAFNEGWAGYWSRARSSFTGAYGTPWPATYLDWNEHQIANKLWDYSRLPGSSDRLMVEVLEANPGTIHSLYDFEKALFARLGMRAPPAPPSCPPGYTDDGATCRSGGEVIPKPSYGRGVGTVPTACGAGNELDAGLCYPRCASGYDGVGPVCWQDCPAGYSDDGAFCRRDGSIISSDNSACPWWDVCGLTTNKGCSVCPAGYQNDGCTCRKDPHIFAKSSYGRGVGWAPNACASGKEYDAGLCYTQCSSGYDGVGPVCWGTCPAGYDDDGATCRRPLSILVKY